MPFMDGDGAGDCFTGDVGRGREDGGLEEVKDVAGVAFGVVLTLDCCDGGRVDGRLSVVAALAVSLESALAFVVAFSVSAADALTVFLSELCDGCGGASTISVSETSESCTNSADLYLVSFFERPFRSVFFVTRPDMVVLLDLADAAFLAVAAFFSPACFFPEAAPPDVVTLSVSLCPPSASLFSSEDTTRIRGVVGFCIGPVCRFNRDRHLPFPRSSLGSSFCHRGSERDTRCRSKAEMALSMAC